MQYSDLKTLYLIKQDVFINIFHMFFIVLQSMPSIFVFQANGMKKNSENESPKIQANLANTLHNSG
jgi:hypothetical protein